MVKRKPDWLKKSILMSNDASRLLSVLKTHHLATVCEEAFCPNRCECFSGKRLTFMILGSICTRSCAFCGVGKGAPEPVDPDEPQRLAEAAAALNLRHAVVTSVTRDDLSDGGAAHFVRVTAALRSLKHPVIVELLVPDFRGDWSAVTAVARSGADIINHNLETVPRLYPRIRPQADYGRSLRLLERAVAAAPSTAVKSGLMVGLGENRREIFRVLSDLRHAGCAMITIGQYLPPTRSHLPAVEYVSPDVFEEYASRARSLGFESVACGPFVRSSYGAEASYQRMADTRITQPPVFP